MNNKFMNGFFILVMFTAILFMGSGLQSIITSKAVYSVGESAKITYADQASFCSGDAKIQLKITKEELYQTNLPTKQYYITTYLPLWVNSVSSIQYWSIPDDDSYAGIYRVTGRVYCGATNNYVTPESFYSFTVEEKNTPIDTSCVNECSWGSVKDVNLDTCLQIRCSNFDTDPCSEWGSYESIPGCVVDTPITCISDWIVGDWGECITGIKTRQVYDSNSCTNPTGIMPSVRMSCEMPEVDPILCNSNWEVTEWSECINGIQIRTVTDSNKCSEPTGIRPFQQQICADTDNPINPNINYEQYCLNLGYDGYNQTGHNCFELKEFDNNMIYIIIGGIIVLFLIGYTVMRK